MINKIRPWQKAGHFPEGNIQLRRELYGFFKCTGIADEIGVKSRDVLREPLRCIAVRVDTHHHNGWRIIKRANGVI
jgi:hypothetical protein